MLNLSDFQFDAVSQSFDHTSSHIKRGGHVAITPSGMREHVTYCKRLNMGIAASIGAFLIPFTIGGGIGVVGALGAGAIGVFEQALVGAVVSGSIGRGLSGQNHSSEKRKLNKVTALDMVGEVYMRKARNFHDVDGVQTREEDVLVLWHTTDDYGNHKTVKSWHNPDHLINLVLKSDNNVSTEDITSTEVNSLRNGDF
jgi:hypothetical protein